MKAEQSCGQMDTTNNENISQSQGQLVKMIEKKEVFTFEELQELRKEVEEHQQIQMTIKNNNPGKVHIQCKHFKSKKCCFQLTFKVDSGQTQRPHLSSIQSAKIAPSEKSSLLCAVSSSSYASNVNSSQETIPQPNKGTAFPFVGDIKCLLDEKSANTSKSLTLGNTASQKLQRGDSCASVPIAKIANSAENNLSSQQILLPKCGAIMEQEEGGEQASISCMSGPQLKAPAQQEQKPLQEAKEPQINPQQSPIFNEKLHNQEQKVCSQKTFIEIKKTDLDVNSSIVLFGSPHHEDEQQTSSAVTSQVAPALEKPKTEVLVLFKLSNFRLNHRNHPVMSDKEYSVHLAKRWLEGHDDKIEGIYSRLREQRGNNFKITPKIIKKVLQDEFEVDIYARCTEAEHRKLLKKKLDNLIKAIRLRERLQSGNSAQKRSSTSKALKKPLIKKSELLTNVSSTHLTSEPASINKDDEDSQSKMEEEEEEESQNSSQNTQHLSAPTVQTREEIKIEDSCDNIKIEDNSKIQQEETHCINFLKQKTSCQTPQITYVKTYNEEWESFLELDQIQQVQNAH